jgi:hypothetical protein
MFEELQSEKIKGILFNKTVTIYMGAGIAQSVERLATGWKVRGSNPGGARFSALIQTGSGAHPASCTMGTVSFPGVKAPGA